MNDDDRTEVRRRPATPPSGEVDTAAIRRIARRRARTVLGLGAAAAIVLLAGLAIVDASSDPEEQAVELAGPADTATSERGVTVEVSVSAGLDGPPGLSTGSAARTGPTQSRPDTTAGLSPTTEQLATTTTATTAMTVTAYDFTVALPAWEPPKNFPLAPQQSGWLLVGDPGVEGGCVWLESPSGERLNALWPPGWTAHFVGHPDGTSSIQVSDAAGEPEWQAGEQPLFAGYRSNDQMPRCDVSPLPVGLPNETMVIGYVGWDYDNPGPEGPP